jgi:hypothetical protein
MIRIQIMKKEMGGASCNCVGKEKWLQSFGKKPEEITWDRQTYVEG